MQAEFWNRSRRHNVYIYIYIAFLFWVSHAPGALPSLFATLPQSNVAPEIHFLKRGQIWKGHEISFGPKTAFALELGMQCKPSDVLSKLTESSADNLALWKERCFKFRTSPWSNLNFPYESAWPQEYECGMPHTPTFTRPHICPTLAGATPPKIIRRQQVHWLFHTNCWQFQGVANPKSKRSMCKSKHLRLTVEALAGECHKRCRDGSLDC